MDCSPLRSLWWQSNAQAEIAMGCTPGNTDISPFNKTWQHLSKHYKKKIISFQASIYLAPPTRLEGERISELKPKRKQGKNKDS